MQCDDQIDSQRNTAVIQPVVLGPSWISVVEPYVVAGRGHVRSESLRVMDFTETPVGLAGETKRREMHWRTAKCKEVESER